MSCMGGGVRSHALPPLPLHLRWGRFGPTSGNTHFVNLCVSLRGEGGREGGSRCFFSRALLFDDKTDCFFLGLSFLTIKQNVFSRA